MSNDEKMKTLMDAVSGISGIAIANASGQVETTNITDVDPELGSIAAAMFSNIGVQTKRMQRGTLKRLILETDKGITVLSNLAGGGLLVVFMDITEGFNLSKLMTAVAKF